VANKVVVGDAEAAGCAALVHIYHDDAAGTGYGFDLMFSYEAFVFWGSVLDGAAFAPDTHDFWGTGKGHEHDANTTIAWLVKMRMCFYSATGKIHVPKRSFIQDAKVLTSFR